MNHAALTKHTLLIAVTLVDIINTVAIQTFTGPIDIPVLEAKVLKFSTATRNFIINTSNGISFIDFDFIDSELSDSIINMGFILSDSIDMVARSLFTVIREDPFEEHTLDGFVCITKHFTESLAHFVNIPFNFAHRVAVYANEDLESNSVFSGLKIGSYRIIILGSYYLVHTVNILKQSVSSLITQGEIIIDTAPLFCLLEQTPQVLYEIIEEFNDENTCEIAELAREFGAFVVYIPYSILDTLVNDEPFDIFNFFNIMQNIASKIGNVCAWKIHAICLLSEPGGCPDVAENVGHVIAAIINITITLIDTLGRMLYHVIENIIPQIADVIVEPISDSMSEDLFNMLGAIKTLLDSLVALIENFSENLASILQVISDFLGVAFLDENSLLAQVLSISFDLILAVMKFFVNLFNGTDAINESLGEIFDALSQLVNVLASFVMDVIIYLVDKIFLVWLDLPGTDYGPMECVFNIGDCLSDILGFKRALLYTDNIYDECQQLQLLNNQVSNSPACSKVLADDIKKTCVNNQTLSIVEKVRILSCMAPTMKKVVTEVEIDDIYTLAESFEAIEILSIITTKTMKAYTLNETSEALSILISDSLYVTAGLSKEVAQKYADKTLAITQNTRQRLDALYETSPTASDVATIFSTAGSLLKSSIVALGDLSTHMIQTPSGKRAVSPMNVRWDGVGDYSALNCGHEDILCREGDLSCIVSGVICPLQFGENCWLNKTTLPALCPVAYDAFGNQYGSDGLCTAVCNPTAHGSKYFTKYCEFRGNPYGGWSVNFDPTEIEDVAVITYFDLDIDDCESISQFGKPLGGFCSKCFEEDFVNGIMGSDAIIARARAVCKEFCAVPDPYCKNAELQQAILMCQIDDITMGACKAYSNYNNYVNVNGEYFPIYNAFGVGAPPLFATVPAEQYSTLGELPILSNFPTNPILCDSTMTLIECNDIHDNTYAYKLGYKAFDEYHNDTIPKNILSFFCPIARTGWTFFNVNYEILSNNIVGCASPPCFNADHPDTTETTDFCAQLCGGDGTDCSSLLPLNCEYYIALAPPYANYTDKAKKSFCDLIGDYQLSHLAPEHYMLDYDDFPLYPQPTMMLDYWGPWTPHPYVSNAAGTVFFGTLANTDARRCPNIYGEWGSSLNVLANGNEDYYSICFMLAPGTDSWDSYKRVITDPNELYQYENSINAYDYYRYIYGDTAASFPFIQRVVSKRGITRDIEEFYNDTLDVCFAMTGVNCNDGETIYEIERCSYEWDFQPAPFITDNC
ncbi:MAG: hypothetical protein GWP19_08145, partial [Planctomycetia bacterium]|nr:hypothetical protein [Planctomycetia bacterium]